MWYAIQHNADNTRFFFDGEFSSRQELESAIERWKKLVTPRMASTTTFEIRCD